MRTKYKYFHFEKMSAMKPSESPSCFEKWYSNLLREELK